MANSVRIHAGVKDDASGPIDKIRDKFDALKKQGATGFAAGVGAAATVKAFSLVGAAASRATGFIADSVKATMEDERSQAGLRAALQANVAAWDGNTDAIEKTIASRVRLGFADDAQRESLAFLVAITKDGTRALDLQRKAMDLARLRHIDLATAGDIVAKVYGGNVGILGRYGIQLTEGTTSTEALAEVTKLAAGQAEAYANTLEGKAEAAQLLFNERMEDLGRVLLPLVAEGLGIVTKALDRQNIAYADVADAAARGSQAAGAHLNELNRQIDEHNAAVARDIEGNRAAMFAAAQQAWGVIPEVAEDEMNEAKQRARKVAASTPGEIAEAMLSRRKAWQDAWETFVDGADKTMTRFAEVTAIKAALASDELTKALASRDPARRAWAAAMIADLEARLGELHTVTASVGDAAGKELNAALARTAPGTAAAAALHVFAVKNALGQLPSSAYGWGYSLARENARGITDGTPLVKHAAESLAATVRNRLRVASPAKEGPWSEGGGPEGWGRRFASLLGKGIADNLPSIRPPGFPAFAPAFAGGAGGSSVVNNTYNLTVTGSLGIGSTSDLAITLQRVASFSRG